MQHDAGCLHARETTNYPYWFSECATQRNAPALPRSKTWWFFLHPPFLRRRSIAGSPGPQGSSGRGPAQSLPFSRLVFAHLFSKFEGVFCGRVRGNSHNGGENRVMAGFVLGEAICCLVFLRNAEMSARRFRLLDGIRIISNALIKNVNQDDGNPRTESPQETKDSARGRTCTRERPNYVVGIFACAQISSRSPGFAQSSVFSGHDRLAPLSPAIVVGSYCCAAAKLTTDSTTAASL